MSLLNIGYHSKYGSFNFTIKDHAQLMLDFEGELSGFLMNEENLNVILNTSQSFPTEAIHFREYGFGYTKEVIEQKLSVGFRAKLLYGKSFLKSDATATTSFDNNLYSVLSSGSINISIPAETVTNPNTNEFVKIDPFASQSIMDYIVNTGNSGYAFDFGVKYSLTHDLKFSASATNVGKISWKTNLHTLNLNGNYELDQTEIEPINVNGLTILSKKLPNISFEDEISKIFDISDVDEVSHEGSIPASYYFALHYKMNNQIHLGIVDRLIKFGELSYNSIAVNINYKCESRVENNIKNSVNN